MAFGKTTKKTEKSVGETAKPIEKLPVAGAKARAARSAKTLANKEAADSTPAMAHRNADTTFTPDEPFTSFVPAEEPKAIAVAAGAGSTTESLIHSRPTREQIAERAYQYFAERGFQHGFADQDWARAEAELSR